MKKLLLIVFVLAICVLAFPQGVMAETILDPQEKTIDATYGGSALEFLVDLNLGEGWVLEVGGDNNLVDNALTFTVSSSHDWSVQADDIQENTPSTEGYMVGDEGPTRHLTRPIQMQYNEDGAIDLTGGPRNVLENYGPISPDTVYHSDLWQEVLASDYGTTLNPFTITIEFTCSSPF
jgi:hypothetical protein